VLQPTKSRREDLPGFLIFFVIVVGIFVVVIALGVLVKLFIFKDFIVIVVGARAGIHVGLRRNHSAGFAAAGVAAGAAAVAPGCVG
jgi:hypothetical protein